MTIDNTTDATTAAHPIPQGSWTPVGQLTMRRGRVWDDGDTNGGPVLACWHAETDTLPWVEAITDHDGKVVDPEHVHVCLPIGVFSRFGEIPQVRVEVAVDGANPQHHSTDDGQGIGVVRPCAEMPSMRIVRTRSQ